MNIISYVAYLKFKQLCGLYFIWQPYFNIQTNKLEKEKKRTLPCGVRTGSAVVGGGGKQAPRASLVQQRGNFCSAHGTSVPVYRKRTVFPHTQTWVGISEYQVFLSGCQGKTKKCVKTKCL